VLRLNTLDGTVTYTLSAGRLDAGQISLSATAPEVSPKFTQSGGAARVSGSNGLRIAGTGVYALSAAGTLQVDDSVFVGGNTAGTFNQSGGTATVGVRVAVGDSTGAGTYTLSGGTLTTAQLDIARGTNAAFTLSGGRLERIRTTRGLPEVEARALYEDSRGWLWIGLRNGGASVTRNPWTEPLQFVNYSTAQNLTSDYVQSITEDEFGRIYLATGKGLARPDESKDEQYECRGESTEDEPSDSET